MALIECIPNISEGRDAALVDRFAHAVARTPGVYLLDRSSDISHHRSVLTFAGTADAVAVAVLALFEQAVATIDLRQHHGVHPRIGAIDVVPFVPLEDASMDDCIALARRVGTEVATRWHVPVYLYEEAAMQPHRRPLEQIRKGQFEGLAEKMRKDEWQPDFGPATPHPSAGASAIGARMPLIAYNINLATDRLDVARKIAAAVRHSSGGLRFVKAMGVPLADRGIVQVSMNLTDYRRTPIARVFELVKREAARYGVTILDSELIGLIPSDALVHTAQYYLQLDAFSSSHVLESRLRHAMSLNAPASPDNVKQPL